MTEWYRCTDWNDLNEAEFFRRLKRARRHRPQYLVIQARTLASTGRPALAATALNLIELVLQEHSESFFASTALHTKAQVLLMLDRWEEAFQAFEESLAARRASPNFGNDAWLEYPLTIARRRLRDRYQRALEVLNEFTSQAGLILPIHQFQCFAALALISADEGDREAASRWARNALAATHKRGPFSRHPGLGLVGMTYAELQIELEQLVID